MMTSWYMRALGGMLLFAMVAEAAVRVTMGAPRDERLPLLRVKPDPRLGYVPLGGDEHYGYDQHVRLNGDGFRGPEFSPKEAGEYRIAVVGGTQVYGLGLDDSELLTARLQTLLRGTQGGERYQVVNLGVRAYTLRQQVRLVQVLSRQLKLDRVILLIDRYSFEDFDITRYYERIRNRTWLMLDLNGQPEGWPLVKWYGVQAARKSALAAWLHSLSKAWRARDTFIGKLLQGQIDDGAAQRFALAKEQLGLVAEFGRQEGFRVDVAILPFVQQVESRDPDLMFQGRMTQMATSLNVSAVDLFPPLRKLSENVSRAPVAPFDEHYDARAHDVIAQALFGHLNTVSAL